MPPVASARTFQTAETRRCSGNSPEAFPQAQHCSPQVISSLSTADPGTVGNTPSLSTADPGRVGNTPSLSTADPGAVGNAPSLSTADPGTVGNTPSLSTADPGAVGNTPPTAVALTDWPGYDPTQ